jgi:hypothetical protein
MGFPRKALKAYPPPSITYEHIWSVLLGVGEPIWMTLGASIYLSSPHYSRPIKILILLTGYQSRYDVIIRCDPTSV